MSALVKVAQLDPLCSLEWLMHYQIPVETLEMYWQDGLEKRDSQLAKSTLCPGMTIGKGLFTTMPIKKGALVCYFPGYWMHDEHAKQCLKIAKGNSYAFSLPVDQDWPAVYDIVFMTHRCDANYINAGKIRDDVQAHPLALCFFPVT